MSSVLMSLAIAGTLGAFGIGRAGEPPPTGAPAPAPERDGAVAPIDCPLHERGVDPTGIRPFAETRSRAGRTAPGSR
jgi:hypothetical protein